MERADVILLGEMRETIDEFRSKSISVGELADRLLALRDHLQFKDCLWAHELTQQIATLDSASTFTPGDDLQANQLLHAITTAVHALLRLIDEKLQ